MTTMTAATETRTERVSAALVNDVDVYARQVVSGAISAGKYHRLAGDRHLKDRARENTPGFPYRFSFARADRFFRFAAKLKHYKGKQFAGKPITLTPVQRFRLGSIFGWRHVDTGLRRFTTSYNELPRKSGKTLEAAVVAVYVTFFEGEPGSEGYCIATKRQQAKLVFDAARKLVISSGLRGRIEVWRHNLHNDQHSQKLEALGADGDSTDGLNPYLIITDEFHAFKNRDLLDVMMSATGARLSYLHFQITTAGKDLVSPCGEQHDYACKILDGLLDEDESTQSFFAFIASADEDDDWLDERTWIKANPHWGISVNPDDMRKSAAMARNIPSAAAEFKQKRLNIWINAESAWLSLDGWRAGQSAVTRAAFIESLRGQTCYLGLDYASKIDLASIVAVFPPTDTRRKWALIDYAFTPQKTLVGRKHRDRAPYDVWVEQGWLKAVPGNRIGTAALRDTIRELDELFNIEGIGFDPWNVAGLEEDLEEDGFDMEHVIEVPQTFSHMSTPSKEFEADVLDGLVDTAGDPLFAWCASNAVVQKDGKDNIQPIKKKSRGRIDPIVAAIIGRKLAMIPPEGPAAPPELVIV